MKAQLFIITFVFLSGLVAAVAGLLIQYGQIDVSEPYLRSDVFMIKSLLSAFNRSLDLSNCSKTEQNVQYLVAFLDRSPPTSFDLGITWSLVCPTNPANQKLYLNLTSTGPGIESKASWVLP